MQISQLAPPVMSDLKLFLDSSLKQEVAAAAARIAGCGDVTRSGRGQVELRPPARSPLFTLRMVS